MPEPLRAPPNTPSDTLPDILPDTLPDTLPDPLTGTVREQREDERAPIALRVDYKRINAFFADYTRNISRGGTFIRTARPLALGTEFVFELSVPVSDASLGSGEFRLAGRVEWIVTTDKATADKPAGMGIRFLFADRETPRKLDAFVEALMRRSLGDHICEKLLTREPDAD